MRGASEAGASALPESTHLFSGPHEDQIEECTFSASALSLSVLRRLHQLRVAAVVGQHQDHRRIRVGVAARGPVVGCGAFPPLRPCLQPEDLCDDIAALGSGEQRAGDDGIGLGDPAVEVITTSLTQGFRRAFDDPGDIVLAHAKPGQMAHLFAYRSIDDKRFLAIRRARLIGILAALVE